MRGCCSSLPGGAQRGSRGWVFHLFILSTRPGDFWRTLAFRPSPVPLLFPLRWLLPFPTAHPDPALGLFSLPRVTSAADHSQISISTPAPSVTSEACLWLPRPSHSAQAPQALPPFPCKPLLQLSPSQVLAPLPVQPLSQKALQTSCLTFLTFLSLVSGSCRSTFTTFPEPDHCSLPLWVVVQAPSSPVLTAPTLLPAVFTQARDPVQTGQTSSHLCWNPPWLPALSPSSNPTPLQPHLLLAGP